jgi:predicted nuclease of predicted toxin-antitoxin system
VKLLLDQDVYELTARFLIGLNHDVVRVAELGMARATDEENLNKAIELNRIFVTRDRDYGNLVFVKEIRSGVLYLRILPSNINFVHAELERVLDLYEETELKSAFVVIEAGKHRFRKI